MKRLFAVLLTTLLLTGSAFAAHVKKEIKDVKKGFWAQSEILEVLNQKIMTIDEDGFFHPEAKVNRADFVEGLIAALGNDEMEVTEKSKFKDVTPKTVRYDSIIRSQQLGLVYGYKDGKFKPTRIVTKAEAASEISHITKDSVLNRSVLDKFTDKKAIPAWAVDCFAKSVAYNVYVAHPKATELLPNKELNRAEMAVLLYRLRLAMNNVQDIYKGPKVTEATIRAEHLSVYKGAENNVVLITNLRNVIQSNNVIMVTFAQDFLSKEATVDDSVGFVVKKDILTDEGTLLLPAGTTLKAKIQEIFDPKWLNKNAKVRLVFNEVVLPDGNILPAQGVVMNKKDGMLMENSWQKPAIYTVAGTVASTGFAIGMAAIPSPQKWGEAVAIGVPVGAGIGLVTGLITPGVNFKGRKGEPVFVKFTEDFSIYTKK